MELLIFKYRRQNKSQFFSLISAVTAWSRWQDNAPAHWARETMQLLTPETPDFIVPTLWQANGPEFSLVDYRIWGSCMDVCTAAGFMTFPSWSRVWSKSGNILTRWSIDHRWSSQAVTFTFSSLQSSTWKIFWTHTLNMFDLRTLTVTCLNVANSGHFMSSSYLAKLAITFADVDRFHWILVICLLLDVLS